MKKVLLSLMVLASTFSFAPKANAETWLAVVYINVTVFELGLQGTVIGRGVEGAQEAYNDSVRRICDENPGLQSWARLDYWGGHRGTGYEFINCN